MAILREVKQFGLLLAVALSLLGLVVPFLAGDPVPYWPWIVAALLAITAFVKPSWLQPLYRAWMAATQVLGWVTTRLALGLVYYLMVLPIGVLRRIGGKDPLVRSWDPSISSYRKEAETPEQDHMERPF